VFSNGIVILALMAIALIWAFDASTTRLIQLYIIGVFVSFTLSQSGMVRHWLTLIARTFDPSKRNRIRRALAINTIGAATTALVLVIVLITKFMHGAWIVVIAMPVVFALMTGIRRHYDRVSIELRPRPGRRDAAEPHPRDRAGLEAACTDAAGAGLRPGDAAADADRTHGSDLGGGDRSADARVGGA